MILMAVTRSPAGVIIFSWTAGVMYSTLFTMPYLLVAHYHASQVVRIIYALLRLVYFYDSPAALSFTL
jgi:solute carrier family 45 protein 1/2/4